MIAGWVESEFATVDFGDKRLDRRLKICVTQAAGLGESTPDRAKSNADLKATYRFADNSKVTMTGILSCHNQAVIERCSKEERVFLCQDTTEIDLTKPKQTVRGAGPLGSAKRQGFLYHPLYAVTEDGLPLGAVDQVLWTRDAASLEVPSNVRKAERGRACFEEKESHRWLEMMQSGEQIARSLPHVQFVMVADSEADISELFCETPDLPDNYNFIIRQGCQHSIVAAIDSHNETSIAASTVDEALSKAQWRGERVVQVGGRDEPVLPAAKKRGRQQARIAREATLSLRAITVVIAGPRRNGGGSLPNVEINVVEALELNPPEGEVPIRWVLFTSQPIKTIEEVHAVVDGYCVRWSVELYFKTLKSGLKIEDMKYETLERYANAFAILSVVAWRVEYLKGATRSDPESSCEKYFPNNEWMAIVGYVHRKVDPKNPPTMRQFMISIAQLGGYINKKSQGEPGSKTIWRGMARFETIVNAFAAFNEMRCGV